MTEDENDEEKHLPPKEDEGMLLISSDESEAMNVEAQAEVNAQDKVWTDLSQCPGMREADKNEEVVNPARRDQVGRRDNWCLVTCGHLQEYRYILHRDEPEASEKPCVRVENNYLELFEFTGYQVPDN